MKQLGFPIVIALISCLFVGAASAEQGKLSGQSIRDLLKNRTVYLATPFGRELPIRYRKNGTMSAKTVKLAKYLSKNAKTKDHGTWWVKGRSLCQRWRNWFEGKSYCVSLTRSGKTVYWKSDDGRSGTARLGTKRSKKSKIARK